MKHIKNIWAVCSALLIIACGDNSQSSIEGKIDNLPEHITEITINSEKKSKTIKIEKDGTFKDTINFNQALSYLRLGTFGKMMFLDKDSQLKITADANDFENTLSYSGKGAKENSYIHQREKITGKIFISLDSINQLEKEKFNAYATNIEQKIEELLDKNKGMNAFLAKTEKEALTEFIGGLKKQYEAANRIQSSLEPGAPSPEFNDLENYKGGTTSLKDLRGNFVYIDVWATWCMPCLQQIPYLQKLEKELHGKKVKFVSLSIDNPSAKDKWKQMIADKNMGGIQLFAGGNIPFVEDYQITGIPRFILLDKEGNIVNANAPRPSDPEFGKYLAELVSK